MRSRSFVAIALTLVVLLAGAGAILVYDHAQRDQLAHGIRVGGIDVGGMSASAAEAKVRSQYLVRLRHPLVLGYGARRFRISATKVHLALDAHASVQEALAGSRAANLFSRVWRSLTGGSINVDLPPQISYSHQAVQRLIDDVARSIDRPARDASISYSGSSISPVSSAAGLKVRTASLSATVQQAIAQGLVAGRLPIPVVRTQPKVSTSRLAARYPTIITINRNAFQLRLWQHLRLAKTYTIAVGQAGLETPAGLHFVIDKEVDPPWHVPNSSWAGSLAGTTVPYGPQDPLRARWIGFYDGDGIHGTDEVGSLGSAASHGCIRMAVPDVIELYPQVPMGAPVYVE